MAVSKTGEDRSRSRGKSAVEQDIDLPPNTSVLVHEEISQTLHPVIPSSSTDELSDKQLGSVSGGRPAPPSPIPIPYPNKG